MTGYRCDGCQQWQEAAPRWILLYPTQMGRHTAFDGSQYRFDSMGCIRLWLDSRITEAVQ